MFLTTNDLTHSAAVNGWDTALPGTSYEDWDFEMAMDPSVWEVVGYRWTINIYVRLLVKIVKRLVKTRKNYLRSLKFLRFR